MVITGGNQGIDFLCALKLNTTAASAVVIGRDNLEKVHVIRSTITSKTVPTRLDLL